MITDQQASDLIREKNPEIRKAIVNAMTEAEVKDYLLQLLRVINGQGNTGLPK